MRHRFARPIVAKKVFLAAVIVVLLAGIWPLVQPPQASAQAPVIQICVGSPLPNDYVVIGYGGSFNCNQQLGTNQLILQYYRNTPYLGTLVICKDMPDVNGRFVPTPIPSGWVIAGEGGFNFNCAYSRANLIIQNLNRPPTPSPVPTQRPSPTPVPNPIDEPRFFVRQHYLDFLNREPDQSGWDFWAGFIIRCGSDAACVDRERVHVSRAFFESIEFQNTGFYVYRLYKASFARFPRTSEFFPDSRNLGDGVVVGTPDWEGRLEANKNRFANEWVARFAFRQQYDNLTNDQYVDRLFANTGVTPSAEERVALVNGLNSGSETRATALRKIAEHPAFVQREFKPAYVLMQYLGYLRRNPDDPPDNNFDGYNFWLNELNLHDDYNNMVRAFIVSTEYRARFGRP